MQTLALGRVVFLILAAYWNHLEGLQNKNKTKNKKADTEALQSEILVSSVIFRSSLSDFLCPARVEK